MFMYFRREEKPKQKPWPKSMFVRAGPGANLHDGLEKSASTENLSARNLTLPSSRGSNDGLEKSASTENLSARNLTLPSSRGSNSAACKSMGFSTCFLSYIGFTFLWKYFQVLSKGYSRNKYLGGGTELF